MERQMSEPKPTPTPRVVCPRCSKHGPTETRAIAPPFSHGMSYKQWLDGDWQRPFTVSGPCPVCGGTGQVTEGMKVYEP